MVKRPRRCIPGDKTRTQKWEPLVPVTSIELPFLLIASPQLVCPEFERSVILLIDHDEEGAFGLIINRRSHMTVAEVVAFDEGEIPAGIPVWQAGPVDPSTGFVLHNQPAADYEQQIAQGISLSASQQSLQRLIDFEGAPDQKPKSKSPKPKILYPFRLMVGYSNWAPGQLDEEFKTGAWEAIPLDRNLLFNSPDAKLWETAIGQITHPSQSSLSLPAKTYPASNSWLH